MSHKKRSKVEGAAGVQLGLIITPMLDMSFQILAFFIMTYHPSALEGHIPGNLTPPEDFAKKSKDNNVAAPVDPLSVPEDLLDPSLNEAITVRVKAIVKGQETGTRTVGSPSQLFVKSNLETEATMIADLEVDFDKALERLEKKLKEMAKGGSKANLKIAADGDLRYQYILMIYDSAKKSGFDKIHFVPPALTKTKLK